MSDLNNNTSQRLTSYRAVIPFYILYDLDLNSNHLRLYGQIEQMESNPNPQVQPTFSYKWFAEQLGIDRSNAIRTANLLKKKGYIEHLQISQGKWVWRIARKPVLHDHTDLGGGDKCDPPSGAQCDPPSGAQCDPKIPKYKIPKKNLKRSCAFDNARDEKTAINISILFEAFWHAYPIKKAKKTCYEKWNNKKLDSIADEIINKLHAQILNDRSWKEGYIPNPLTYINQERWNDDIDTTMPKTNKKPGDCFNEYMQSRKQKGNIYEHQHQATPTKGVTHERLF